MSIQYGTKYPVQVDNIGAPNTNASFASVADGTTDIDGYLFNDIYGAIVAIETELGVDPSTSYPDMRAVVTSYNVQHNIDGTHKYTTITDNSSNPALSVIQNGVGIGILANVTLGVIFEGYVGSNLKIKVANDGTLTGDKILVWSFREAPLQVPNGTTGFDGTMTFTLTHTPVSDPGATSTITSEHVYVNGILQEVSPLYSLTLTSTAVATVTVGTITKSGAGWTTNQWAGYSVVIVDSGYEQIHKVASNSADTIALDSGNFWLPTITVGAQFVVGNDYYISGNNIVFLPGSIPPVNSTLKVTYAYFNNIS